MKTKTTIARCLAAVVLAWFGALASVAQADTTIINGFGTSYLFASGDAANYGMTFVNGAGPGGSSALVITTDFSGQGWGQIDYSDRYQSVSGNTSMNLSDYTLSFDAAAKSSIALPYVFLVVSGVHNGNQSQASAFLSFSAQNTYQHFTLNLGSDVSGPQGALDPLSTFWQLDFNMENSYFGDPSIGNQLSISNIRLTMVPEPSSLALALLPLAGLISMAFLRRRQLRP